jgi:hypothetical protein
MAHGRPQDPNNAEPEAQPNDTGARTVRPAIAQPGQAAALAEIRAALEDFKRFRDGFDERTHQLELNIAETLSSRAYADADLARSLVELLDKHNALTERVGNLAVQVKALQESPAHGKGK